MERSSNTSTVNKRSMMEFSVESALHGDLKKVNLAVMDNPVTWYKEKSRSSDRLDVAMVEITTTI